MARPSKLTDKQWGEIGRRLASGESQYSLAKEFKIAQSVLSDRFREKTEVIKALASQSVEIDRRIEALPVSDRLSVMSLIDRMKSVQDNYAEAADNGAKTAAHLSRLAKVKAERLNEHSDTEELRSVAALSETANKALVPASNLIAANKQSTPTTPPEIHINTGVPRED